MPVSDMRPKKFPVELDKSRTLCYDFNAFAEIDEKYGSVQDALKALQVGKLKDIRFLLWAGLLHEDESLTERQVGSMFTFKDVSRLAGPMMDGIKEGLPRKDDSHDEADPKNE